MNLQNMAPNVQRAFVLTLSFLAVAAGIYFFAIESTESALSMARRTLREETARHRAMETDLARAGDVQSKMKAAEARLAEYDSALIRPLLESTAMRAKSLVDSLASGCGLVGMEYETLPPMELPLVGRAAARRFVRCPVRIGCVGSYQAAVSFLRCVEREFPLVALGAFSVTARSEPDMQQVSIVLEWPMERKGAPAK